MESLPFELDQMILENPAEISASTTDPKLVEISELSKKRISAFKRKSVAGSKRGFF